MNRDDEPTTERLRELDCILQIQNAGLQHRSAQLRTSPVDVLNHDLIQEPSTQDRFRTDEYAQECAAELTARIDNAR